MLKGQRYITDPIGWGSAFFKCKIYWYNCLLVALLTNQGIVTYIMLWPKDSRMMKEDIRRVYDRSIFYVLAERRAKGK